MNISHHKAISNVSDCEYIHLMVDNTSQTVRWFMRVRISLLFNLQLTCIVACVLCEPNPGTVTLHSSFWPSSAGPTTSLFVDITVIISINRKPFIPDNLGNICDWNCSVTSRCPIISCTSGGGLPPLAIHCTGCGMSSVKYRYLEDCRFSYISVELLPSIATSTTCAKTKITFIKVPGQQSS